MKPYDIIIAGGGIAGLSLAYQLINSPLRDRSILIIDKAIKQHNDRTLCFWTKQPTAFDTIVAHSWRKLHLAGDDFSTIADLGAYRYAMLRGIDFYRFVQQALANRPNVTFMQGVVEHIADGSETASVTVAGESFHGTWVFDSIFQPKTLRNDPNHFHQLQLHFKGWEIETAQPVFTPAVATLMDFRTPQHNEPRFFYVLPFTPQRALVEFTAFTARHFSHAAYAQALQGYLQTTHGIAAYQVVAEEAGVIPVIDRPRGRRAGQHVMTIGTNGGRVKPTTGYGFTRIQRDSAAIVASLRQYGHPFAVPADARLYRWLDQVMLRVMAAHGGEMQRIFGAMFTGNPITTILRFLDEAATPWDIARLVASLPKRVFLEAALSPMAGRPVSVVDRRWESRVGS